MAFLLKSVFVPINWIFKLAEAVTNFRVAQNKEAAVEFGGKEGHDPVEEEKLLRCQPGRVVQNSPINGALAGQPILILAHEVGIALSERPLVAIGELPGCIDLE